jgi:hypothetical protein
VRVVRQPPDKGFAVDHASDQLLRLNDVPKLKWLPRRRGGARLHVSTVYRWAATGVRAPDGTVIKLHTVRCGGTLCCTEADVREFFASLSRHDSATATPTPAPRSPSARARAAERAGKQLECMGV